MRFPLTLKGWHVALIALAAYIVYRGFVVTTEVKGGVRLGGLRPEMDAVVLAVERVWREEGLGNPVITSGVRDYNPASNSKHPEGLALDYRINNVSEDRWVLIGRKVAALLDVFLFDVILEVYQDNKANSHLHIEYDPHPKQTNFSTLSV